MLLKWAKQNAAKAVIWLTAAMFALPAVPASACHCSSISQTSGCCCGRQSLSPSAYGCCSTQQRRTCCSHDEQTTTSCCESGISAAPAGRGCCCGTSGGCHRTNHPVQPPEPLPVQDDSAAKILGADNFVSLAAPMTLPSVRHSAGISSEPIALIGSLERCVFLSRFRL